MKALLLALAFYSLPITGDERATITSIVHTLAEESVWALLWKKKEIDRLSAQIDHVHPLRFFWHLATDEGLRRDVPRIRKNRLKWRRFLAECKRRLEGAEIEPHLRAFCRELGLPYEPLRQRVRARDWDGFVCTVFDTVQHKMNSRVY